MTPTIENKEDKEEKEEKEREPSSPEPSHTMTGEYVALMETSGKECESWYYFIRREGNEEALAHLQSQLEQVDWYILDDLSTFDLDLEHFVSAQTAKEMTKLELNAQSFHRKFDGKLQKIDFNFKKKDLKNNERMMEKVFDILGYGQIEEFIDDEDLDPEDLTDTPESDSTEQESEESSSEDEKESQKKDTKGIPPALLKKGPDLPGWAKKRKGHHRR